MTRGYSSRDREWLRIPRRGRDDRPAPRGWKERGSAAAIVILFLPCLLAGLALVVDAGVLLGARAQMRAAADMGALAGVQDLDLELLAAGRLFVVEEEAAADASAWVEANLSGRPFLVPGSTEVRVTVLNPPQSGTGEPAVCPVTGRTLSQPTVCVLISAEPDLPFFGGLGPTRISIHADASVVGRP